MKKTLLLLIFLGTANIALARCAEFGEQCLVGRAGACCDSDNQCIYDGYRNRCQFML